MFNKLGFTLIETIVIAALVGTILAFSGSLIVSLVRDQRRDQFVAKITMVRDNFVELLKDPDAWKETVDAYGGTVPAGAGQLFSPRMVDGTRYLNYNVEATGPGLVQGFSVDGTPCVGFIAPPAAGNPNCPIRLEFRWNRVAGSCAGAPGPCVPNASISVTAVVNGGTAPRWVAINPDRINLPPMVRSGETLTMQNPTCNSAAGEVVTGFDGNGDPICARAIDVRADAIALLPPPPPPPPPPLSSWGPTSPPFSKSPPSKSPPK